MGLTYDNSGVHASVVARGGITDDERKNFETTLEQTRQTLFHAWKSEKLGFFACPDTHAEPLVDWANRHRDGYTDQVVIGIGGSSLGTRAVLNSRLESPAIRTHFAENIDPTSFAALITRLDLAKTLFIVISKSGNTIETMAQFWIIWDKLIHKLGPDEARKNVVMITDPESGDLRKMVREVGFEAWAVPPNVGGRFSVLTAVGLVPLALAGYPIGRLLDGARQARDRAFELPIDQNPTFQAALDSFVLGQRGYTQTVMFTYSDELRDLAEWFCQLWGESLGKARNRKDELVFTGLSPVRAVGVIDQHSQVQLYAEGPFDKHIVFCEVDHFPVDMTVPEREGFPAGLSHLLGKSLSEIFAAELQGTRRAIEEAGRPSSRWMFSNITPEAIGAFLFSWEFITAIVGELLDINAFDQPGVELGKKIAHGLLGKAGHEEYQQLGQDRVARNSRSII
jgi:glucose-6-phosphate isomerase